MTDEVSRRREGMMPLTSHLKEIRNRLIVCILTFIIASIVCYSFTDQIMDLLTDMGTRYGYSFIYISPQELILVYFNIAFLAGFIISLPVIITQVFQFLKPALTKKHQAMIFWSLVLGGVFFVIGILFAYYISVPFMLEFLISFSSDSAVTASISINEFISFLLTVFVIFGCVFEMPVVSVILSRLGLLKAAWLKKGRSAAVVVIFLVAAIITPPDVVSQFMVAIPMLFLYELSIILARIFEKKQEYTAEETE